MDRVITAIVVAACVSALIVLATWFGTVQLANTHAKEARYRACSTIYDSGDKLACIQKGAGG